MITAAVYLCAVVGFLVLAFLVLGFGFLGLKRLAEWIEDWRMSRQRARRQKVLAREHAERIDDEWKAMNAP